MSNAEKVDQQRIRRLFTGLHLCGCGSGTNYELLLEMLERAEDHDRRGSFYDPLGDTPARAVEFIAHVMDGWELLEHGTGIGYAWLTDKGRELLAFLRTYGTDDENWPAWWCSCPADEEF